MNDGLTLPLVVILLAASSEGEFELSYVAGEVSLGVVLGVLVPWAAIRLERTRFFSAHTTYAPLNAFAIALLVFALLSMTHANEFLAAFAAGITVATVGPEVLGLRQTKNTTKHSEFLPAEFRVKFKNTF